VSDESVSHTAKVLLFPVALAAVDFFFFLRGTEGKLGRVGVRLLLVGSAASALAIYISTEISQSLCVPRSTDSSVSFFAAASASFFALIYAMAALNILIRKAVHVHHPAFPLGKEPLVSPFKDDQPAGDSLFVFLDTDRIYLSVRGDDTGPARGGGRQDRLRRQSSAESGLFRRRSSMESEDARSNDDPEQQQQQRKRRSGEASNSDAGSEAELAAGKRSPRLTSKASGSSVSEAGQVMRAAEDLAPRALLYEVPSAGSLAAGASGARWQARSGSQPVIVGHASSVKAVVEVRRLSVKEKAWLHALGAVVCLTLTALYLASAVGIIRTVEADFANHCFVTWNLPSWYEDLLIPRIVLVAAAVVGTATFVVLSKHAMHLMRYTKFWLGQERVLCAVLCLAVILEFSVRPVEDGLSMLAVAVLAPASFAAMDFLTILLVAREDRRWRGHWLLGIACLAFSIQFSAGFFRETTLGNQCLGSPNLARVDSSLGVFLVRRVTDIVTSIAFLKLIVILAKKCVSLTTPMCQFGHLTRFIVLSNDPVDLQSQSPQVTTRRPQSATSYVLPSGSSTVQVASAWTVELPA
jgi:hypothetical protein